jgi:hypothetical protein
VPKTEQITLKALKNLDVKQQILFVESYLPDAYEYLTDTIRLPKFDENDEIIKEDKNHASIS